MSEAHIDLTDLDGAVTGAATVSYDGVGDGVAVVSAEVCEGLDREGVATFAADGCGDVVRRVSQEGMREAFTDWDFLCADGGTLHVLKGAYYSLTGGSVDTVVTIDGVDITVAAGATVTGVATASITSTEQTLRAVHVRGDVALSLGNVDMERASEIEVLEYHYTGAGRTFSRLISEGGGPYNRTLTTVILSGTPTAVACMLGCMADYPYPDTIPEYDALTTIDIAGLDVSALTSLAQMFACWSGVAAFNGIGGYCTSKITSLAGMFYWCKAVESLDLSQWDTRNVRDMSHTFDGCAALTTLDLSRWDTSKVTDMSYTFRDCSALTTLRLGSWDLSECMNFTDAFYYCTSLTTVTGTISGIYENLSLSQSPLTRDSALVFINGLHDYAAEGGTGCTLTLSSATKALLTDDDIQIATDKGWTIA